MKVLVVWVATLLFYQELLFLGLVLCNKLGLFLKSPLFYVDVISFALMEPFQVFLV